MSNDVIKCQRPSWPHLCIDPPMRKPKTTLLFYRFKRQGQKLFTTASFVSICLSNCLSVHLYHCLAVRLSICLYSQWTKHCRYIYHTTDFDPTYCSKTKYCMRQSVAQVTAGCNKQNVVFNNGVLELQPAVMLQLY